MGQQIAILEPIKAPDQRRPDQMPSLPAWVALRLASLSEEQQPDAMGNYRAVTTLPQKMLPNPNECQAIERHLAELRPLLDQTPIASADLEAATLVLVTKMMMALPSQRSTEAGAEAAGEAFMAALDDVPSWAVGAAIRRWYRGESQKTARDPHDFRWRPAPATLRKLAQIEAHRVRGRILDLERLLNAEQRLEYTDEQRAANLERLSILLRDVFGKKEPLQEAAE